MLAQLIRNFTLPTELLLDCFAGSGGFCAAAMLTGHNYFGIELWLPNIIAQPARG